MYLFANLLYYGDSGLCTPYSSCDDMNCFEWELPSPIEMLFASRTEAGMYQFLSFCQHCNNNRGIMYCMGPDHWAASGQYQDFNPHTGIRIQSLDRYWVPVSVLGKKQNFNEFSFEMLPFENDLMLLLKGSHKSHFALIFVGSSPSC